LDWSPGVIASQDFCSPVLAIAVCPGDNVKSHQPNAQPADEFYVRHAKQRTKTHASLLPDNRNLALAAAFNIRPLVTAVGALNAQT
jgi:hypothetical protein